MGCKRFVYKTTERERERKAVRGNFPSVNFRRDDESIAKSREKRESESEVRRKERKEREREKREREKKEKKDRENPRPSARIRGGLNLIITIMVC